MSNTYITGEQTKQNILDESKRLFYENGYNKTTYNDISTAAKVNRALIPYHFNSKQQLGVAIYQQIMEEFYQLIDNVLDTSQFDSDFVNILHTILSYRLLANNPQFSHFLKELSVDQSASLFCFSNEKTWLRNLGDKFISMDETRLDMLTRIHIGMKKEIINLLCNLDSSSNSDQIATMHLNMLMNYAGYSAKKIDELIQASLEVSNLFTFEIQHGFVIKLSYN